MRVVEFAQDGRGRNIEYRSYEVEDGGIEMDVSDKQFPLTVFFEPVMTADLIEVCEFCEIEPDEVPPYNQARAEVAIELWANNVKKMSIAELDEFAACLGKGVTQEEKEAAQARAADKLREEIHANRRERHAAELELQEEVEKMMPKPKK